MARVVNGLLQQNSGSIIEKRSGAYNVARNALWIVAACRILFWHREINIENQSAIGALKIMATRDQRKRRVAEIEIENMTSGGEKRINGISGMAYQKRSVKAWRAASAA